MVTSITALRTHLYRKYGTANIIETSSAKLSKKTLVVKMNPHVKIMPMDEKLYDVELLESEQNYKKYRFSLAKVVSEHKGHLPVRFASCLNLLKELSDEVKIVKTPAYHDVCVKDISTEFQGVTLKKSCQQHFGTYDVIVAQATVHCTQDVLDALEASADFYDKTIGTYYICFLRRYAIRGRDSRSQHNELARWYVTWDLYDRLYHLRNALAHANIEPREGHAEDYKLVDGFIKDGIYTKAIVTDVTDDLSRDDSEVQRRLGMDIMPDLEGWYRNMSRTEGIRALF